MSEVLYRKYRPKNFNELVGQDQVKEVLIKSFEKSSISHAYIFSGSRGPGKPPRARIFATMLPGLGEATVERLYLAGIYDAATLREADPEKVSSITGIPKARLHDYIGYLK